MNTYNIFYNTSKDIYHHLAVEKYLLNTVAPHTNILYIWQSRGAVVIGKHQNVWKECNYKICLKNNIAIARRLSGGVAIFQDLGNINFSFISSRDSYSVENNFTILLNTLSNLGIKAERNQKNDILVAGKKNSDSSFCIKKHGVLHHASLLINTNLPLLYHVLQPSFSTIESNGVNSEHSEVTNSSLIVKKTSINTVIDSVIKEFQHVYATTIPVQKNSPLVSVRSIQAWYEELSSNKWIFGRNPFWSVLPSDDGYDPREKIVSILNNGKPHDVPCYTELYLEEPVL